MSSDEIIELVRNAFRNAACPDHFTDYAHCYECADHGRVLRSHDLDTLTMEDIGNPCWDPVCYLTPQAFLYYFPAFVRLTLEDKENSWLPQYLFHLSFVDERFDRFGSMDDAQMGVILLSLYDIRDEHEQMSAFYMEEGELARVITKWEAVIAARKQSVRPHKDLKHRTALCNFLDLVCWWCPEPARVALHWRAEMHFRKDELVELSVSSDIGPK